MELNYEPFLDRSSIYGVVRWPKPYGKAVNAPPQSGLNIQYVYVAPSPGDEAPPIYHRSPMTEDYSTNDEYIVGYWGPGIIQPGAEQHHLMVQFQYNVPWENPTDSDLLFRSIDRPWTTFDPRPAGVIGLNPVHIYFQARKFHEFDSYLRFFELKKELQGQGS